MKVADLTSIDREILLNGCGPQDSPWLSWVSRWALSVFEGACAQHDLDYRVGGDERDREDADLDFLGAMNAIAGGYWWPRSWALRWAAFAAYEAVRKHGRASFVYRAESVPVTRDLLMLEESERQKLGLRNVSPLAQARALARSKG